MANQLPTVQPLKNITSYRYIRFVRTLRRNYDSIEVFFDTEKIAQLYFSIPSDFLVFLDNRHNLLKDHENIYIALKRAVTHYNVVYVLDIKKWTIVEFEEPPARRKTIKEEINEEVSELLHNRGFQTKAHQQVIHPQININRTSRNNWLFF